MLTWGSWVAADALGTVSGFSSDSVIPMKLGAYPIVVPLPVMWADQDLFGHVNNTVFLKWIESARVAYWDGSLMREYMRPRNLGPILASIQCDYKHQVHYPDQIEVGAKAVKLGRTSITMQHEIYSEQRDGIVASGKSVVVMFDYAQQQKYVISDELRGIIERCEQRVSG